jgi:hypothetical protein
MQFNVVAINGSDTSQLPMELSTIERYQEEDAVRVRTLELTKEFDSSVDVGMGG